MAVLTAPALYQSTPRVFIDGSEVPGVVGVNLHRDYLEDAYTIEIDTKDAHMSQFSTHISVDPSGSRAPKGDQPEVRQTLARLIEEGLRNATATEIDDALVLADDPENDGPLGGRSSSVLAYVTLKGESEPVAVAINVYADDKIAAKAEKRLDEIEAQTVLRDRLDRVRGLLEGEA